MYSNLQIDIRTILEMHHIMVCDLDFMCLSNNILFSYFDQFHIWHSVGKKFIKK